VFSLWLERRGAYRVLVGKPNGKRTLGRTRHAWEDNIRMDRLNKSVGRAWTGLMQPARDVDHLTSV
jgi:hypothetical protein